jgi:DHA3 family macrolide efflux protein-like MFS transporter
MGRLPGRRLPAVIIRDMSSVTATAPAVPMSFRDVLRIDVMRRVWYAQLVSLFGDFLALFAVIAVVSFAMRGTPRQIVGVQIAYMLPIVFIGPIAGVFVDRWPVKPTLIASDVLRALIALLLIPAVSVWHVYVVLAALSCVSAFFGPAQQVTIRTHVPTHGLIAANALMQMAFMGSRIVGPSAAGAIVLAFGPKICYGIDVLSFVVSAALIASVAINRASPPKGQASSANRLHQIWLDLRQGLTFIVHHAAVVFVVLAMAAGLFTVGCFGPLVAIHVRDTLRGSEALFGIVSGTVGFGMLAGTQFMRRLTQKFADDAVVLSGLAGIGVGALVLGMLPYATAAVAAMGIIGVSFSAIMVPAQTLLQRETPREMIARVSSTNLSVAFLAQILGLVLSGYLADALGVRMVFILCAGLALALAAGGRAFLRRK